MPAYVRYDDTYQESGFRHNTISLCVGDSADHLHIVQTWGQGWQAAPTAIGNIPIAPAPRPMAPGATGRALGNALPVMANPLTLRYDYWSVCFHECDAVQTG